MCHSHSLCRICNQISGNQRIFHAHMPHGNAVADCNGRKYHRSSPCHGNAQFHGIYDFIQVHMSRYDFIIRADNSHQRFFHFFLGDAQSMKQGPVRRLLHSFFYCVTSHLSSFLPTFLFVPSLLNPLCNETPHLCGSCLFHSFRVNIRGSVALF